MDLAHSTLFLAVVRVIYYVQCFPIYLWTSSLVSCFYLGFKVFIILYTDQSRRLFEEKKIDWRLSWILDGRNRTFIKSSNEELQEIRKNKIRAKVFRKFYFVFICSNQGLILSICGLKFFEMRCTCKLCSVFCLSSSTVIFG